MTKRWERSTPTVGPQRSRLTVSSSTRRRTKSAFPPRKDVSQGIVDSRLAQQVADGRVPAHDCQCRGWVERMETIR